MVPELSTFATCFCCDELYFLRQEDAGGAQGPHAGAHRTPTADEFLGALNQKVRRCNHVATVVYTIG